jgi:hypothetical protein
VAHENPIQRPATATISQATIVSTVTLRIPNPVLPRRTMGLKAK